MKIIENKTIKEKLFIEKLKDGLTVMIIPKKNIQKKYIIWGTNYGSNDNKFIVPGENNETEVPNGVAHFLEHKLFEQENGTNSLDVLSALGVSANAYTTNDHTAYLYECTENFYEALDEFMDYVQNPYFTDQNVEKEKGIIGQEIMMYDDYPDWKVYLNAIQSMYSKNPVKIDITGTIETISKIDKDILYKCYNTFYNPANMVLVVCGDFEPKDIILEIEKRLIEKEPSGEIKRIYEEEPKEIVRKRIEEKMEVSQPLYTIGIKDTVFNKENKVKRHLVVEILLNILFGKSSELYKKLYQESIIYSEPSMDYEFSRGYAHILITGQSVNPDKVFDELKIEINKLKVNGIDTKDFERIKKMIYGLYVKQYNDVSDISRMFLSDHFKDINSFDYLDQMDNIDINYAKDVLIELFDENNMVLSIINKL